MSRLILKVMRVGDVKVPLPSYKSRGASGLDLHAAVPEEVVVPPGARRLIPTGIAMAIPEGYEGQVRPRSGLALLHGVSIVNSPGTIDADFRGEVGIVLINHGSEPFIVQPSSRIAQLVIAPVERVEVTLAKELDATSRGEGGYGSTGV